MKWLLLTKNHTSRDKFKACAQWSLHSNVPTTKDTIDTYTNTARALRPLIRNVHAHNIQNESVCNLLLFFGCNTFFAYTPSLYNILLCRLCACVDAPPAILLNVHYDICFHRIKPLSLFVVRVGSVFEWGDYVWWSIEMIRTAHIYI